MRGEGKWSKHRFLSKSGQEAFFRLWRRAGEKVSEKSLADSLLGPAKAGKQARIKKKEGGRGPKTFSSPSATQLIKLKEAKAKEGEEWGSPSQSPRDRKSFSLPTRPQGAVSVLLWKGKTPLSSFSESGFFALNHRWKNSARTQKVLFSGGKVPHTESRMEMAF